MNSKVFDIIDDMEVYINDSNALPFQSNKVVVRSDLMDEFITQIRLALPEEIKRANAIIDDREHMMSIAQEKLAEIEEEAVNRAKALVDEHEITRQAQAKAEAILDKAYKQSEEIRREAYRYTDELLEKAQKTISALLNQSNTDYSKFEKTLLGQLDTIEENREVLKE